MTGLAEYGALFDLFHPVPGLSLNGAPAAEPVRMTLTPADGTAPIALELYPIPGGVHIKDLPDGTCVDVLRMFYNHRMVVTDRRHCAEHGRADIVAAWCYAGTGPQAVLAAVTAAALFDGTTDPVGWIKRAR